MPILLRGLHLEDTELRINIFETLLQVAKDSADLGATNTGPLAEHAGSLVKASLSNSQNSEATTPVCQTYLRPNQLALISIIRVFKYVLCNC
jgi:hypothetical protein